MTILHGWQIASRGIISPYSRQYTLYNDFGRAMSGGESAIGYDVTVEFDSAGELDMLRLPPGGFALASTAEYFNMPQDVVGIVHDKSSWAREGIAVQNTVIEPGWRGYLTLELSNHSPLWITIRRGWPIAQVLFHQLEQAANSYTGKYQDQQRGPQGAR